MNGHSPGYKPLQDCCSLSSPQVVRRHVASMAFNFSAFPERVPQAQPIGGKRAPSQQSALHRVMRIFNSLEFYPAG